ncbi:MAG: hypothetical protein WCH40_13265, partial [Verrucomicrobiales bacterium]
MTMGFLIEYSPDLRQVANRLTESPTQIFRKPYAGYLIFLVENATAGDKATLKWLTEATDRLDRMTGELVAYALVTLRFGFDVIKQRNFEFQLASTPDGRKEACDHMTAKRRVEIDDNEFDIRRLVSKGVWGPVTDTCHLEAMNKAVRQLADEWGVLDQLPCMVAIDGFRIDSSNRTVVTLEGKAGPEIEKCVEDAVTRLRQHPEIDRYLETMKSLHRAAQERAELVEPWATSAPKPLLKEGKNLLGQMIRNGRHEELVTAASSGLFVGDRIVECLEAQRDRILGCGRVAELLYDLQDWETWVWPLTERRLRRSTDLVESKLGPLHDLGIRSDPRMYSEEPFWRDWIRDVRRTYKKAVNDIHADVEGALTPDDVSVFLSSLVNVEVVAGWKHRADELEQALHLAMETLGGMVNRPSWSAMWRRVTLPAAESIEEVPCRTVHFDLSFAGKGRLKACADAVSRGRLQDFIEWFRMRYPYRISRSGKKPR